MALDIVSVRPFIGCRDLATSRSFYQELGFEEKLVGPKLWLLWRGNFSFYLQDAYVEDWLNNTMLFIEVKNVEECYEWLQGLQFEERYLDVKLTAIRKEAWGQECFLTDPGGVLLHFGAFYQTA